MPNSRDASDGGSIFKWETLQAIAPHDLNTRPPAPGKMVEVELTSGHKVRAWRGDDGRSYFCHGLTFGGKAAPGGPLSPYTGRGVETILQDYYQVLGRESSAKPGDIVVWWGARPDSTPHSAILTDPVVVPGKSSLDYSFRLQTKNGLRPEANMPLEEIVLIYGETYNVYTRK